MVSQTSLPSGANIPPTLLLLPLFAPNRTVNRTQRWEVADARFFPTNLVKDTKIRHHWSRVLLSRQARWSYRCNGIRGVDDTWIDG